MYDNYSKLIKAVGTIGDMQRGMQRGRQGDGGLDGVEALSGRISGLEESVRALGTEGRRAEDGERKRRRREKEVVKGVLEAPGRIETLIAEGRREEAEMEWARMKRWLDSWEGVEGVEEVRRGCQEIMRRTPEDG